MGNAQRDALMGIIEILESGGDDDLDMGIFSGHDMTQFHAVHIRHFDIGKKNIGQLFFHDRERILPGDGFRDDLHIQRLPVGGCDQHFACRFFIICDNNLKH